MYIVTGGAGFIGSATVWMLNRRGIDDIWIVDDLAADASWKNLAGLRFAEIMGSEEFLRFVEARGRLPDGAAALVHLGACSNTVERNAGYLLMNNYRYSVRLAQAALATKCRMLVASTAAVYGDGEWGNDDGVDGIHRLRPLNMYGYSKLLFDRWMVRRKAVDRLAALRFYNVYGPNEYHKGEMASMAYKAYGQIRERGSARLFKSYRAEYADGGQMRDFVYIKDVVDVLWWFLERPEANGFFNVGSGVAESWNSLIEAVFSELRLPVRIEYIDMPDALRGQYQYHTRADTSRLRRAGYAGEFRAIRDGVNDYIVNHLTNGEPYLTSG